MRVGRPDPQLVLAAGDEPAASGDAVALHAEGVRAALGVTGSELATLLTAAPTAKLTREHLSALYREVSLARALRASIADLMAVRRLQQVDILTVQTPAAVAAATELYDAILRWGWSPQQLVELLTGSRPAGSMPLVDEGTTAALQRALRTARQTSQWPVGLDAPTLAVVLLRLVDQAHVTDLATYFAPTPRPSDCPGHGVGRC